MEGDDLDGLLFTIEPLLLHVLGRCQMPSLALAPRHRLVGNLAEQVLQEAVLPALRGAQIRLEREDLLAHESRKHLVDVSLRHAGNGDQRAPRERLPHDGCVL